MMQAPADVDFFTEYGEGSRYRIEEVIGKGSYGLVCSAYDTHLREKVAIKKINDIFEHVSDATRILREIKLLRLLRHPDIVEIKHILLPPSRREFKDIYVVFELMESDLHQVIKANDDLTREHYQFFLYQLLRGLKYLHTANVFHRDLKPKNILANADCKLKICDFGLARVAFNDTPTAIFWTDYVATRWYRAPELCGSFFSKYTPAIDIWSIGCIFSELLTGKPLFPGKNVVHQLDLMTDLLGTASPEAIARIRNEKARRYLSSMRKKKPIPFSQKFPNADPLALRLLERMLAFDPKDRPTAEEALADSYFKNLSRVEREPSAQPVSKMEFEFERRRITKDDIRELIYREILEYHPQMLQEFLEGAEPTSFMYPSVVDKFKKQFAFLEERYGNGGTGAPLERQQSSSLPRTSVIYSDNSSHNSAEVADNLSRCSIVEAEKTQIERYPGVPMSRFPVQVPQSIQGFAARPEKVINPALRYNYGVTTVAPTEVIDQRRIVRNPAALNQYPISSNYVSEDRENESEGANVVQHRPDMYMSRNVAAAQSGPGSRWY
ncbi:non-receptor serine/threonine protein kinase [Lithospermum erythrorhizon]|uniref:mitogen-activated protein kinase n=1 Tax=Lithospermum erythrorhizon TaxID=34254 RepID=A0AAV3NWU7_LITER